MMTLAQAAEVIGASRSGIDAEFASVSSDSRSIVAGQLFIALHGERFDGHDYVTAVLAASAAGAMVNRGFAARHPDLPLLAVDDTRAGFAALASHWRRRFSLPVIAVVGSNGKTTVKEMCAAILRAHFGVETILATTGNLNNDIGVPTMVLRMGSQHRAAVIEIGMNHPGETAILAPVVQPGVALIVNAQREHQEFMKSVLAVADEHAAIIDALGPEGIAVFNADDAHAAVWRRRAGSRVALGFGLDSGDVRGDFHSEGFGGALALSSPWGRIETTLGVPGRHNALNACGAAAACLAAGVSPEAVSRGLAAFAGVKGRLQRRPGKHGTLVIDDTYNANPDSMRAAVDVLCAIPGRRIFVMGDMGEVGETAGQMHDEIGGYAKSRGVDRLLCIGEHSAAAARNFDGGAEHFTRIDELVRVLEAELGPQVSVLVKGSRFMRMERVTDAIADKGKAHNAA